MTLLTVTNSCSTSDHGYVPLVANTFKSFPHSRFIIGFVIRVIRRVQILEKEILPFRSTWVHTWFLVARSFVFRVVICISLFVLLFFFFWPLCCLYFLDLRILIILWYRTMYIPQSTPRRSLVNPKLLLSKRFTRYCSLLLCSKMLILLCVTK